MFSWVHPAASWVKTPGSQAASGRASGPSILAPRGLAGSMLNPMGLMMLNGKLIYKMVKFPAAQV